MSPAFVAQRRAIIRATWQRMFRDSTFFRTVFVISRPEPAWVPLIQAENATYHDLIEMDLEENAYVANHVKTIEFLTWLAAQGRPWQFVSKIDDDSFLDPFAMYSRFLAPLEVRVAEPTPLRTIVARKLTWPQGDFVLPGGRFYTLTWDMVELVTRLWRTNHLTDEFEDVLIGRMLHEAGEPWNLVTLENPVAFDYSDDHGEEIDGVKTAWAKPNDDQNAWVHGVGPAAVNPHKMKMDEEYLRVAAYFGPRGLVDKQETVARSRAT